VCLECQPTWALVKDFGLACGVPSEAFRGYVGEGEIKQYGGGKQEGIEQRPKDTQKSSFILKRDLLAG
jgi:hypothetical protein